MKPIRFLGLTARTRHPNQTPVTGIILAVDEDEIYVPARKEQKKEASVYIIDLKNALYIKRRNEEILFEDEFQFLHRAIPASIKDRIREKLGKRRPPDQKILILG